MEHANNLNLVMLLIMIKMHATANQRHANGHLLQVELLLQLNVQ